MRGVGECGIGGVGVAGSDCAGGAVGIAGSDAAFAGRSGASTNQRAVTGKRKGGTGEGMGDTDLLEAAAQRLPVLHWMPRREEAEEAAAALAALAVVEAGAVEQAVANAAAAGWREQGRRRPVARLLVTMPESSLAVHR